MDRLRLGAVLGMLAARNVWLHRSKSITIAILLGFGTAVIVIGFSVLKEVESTMKESIIGSVAGHLQIHSADSKDSLALFGGSFMGREDIGIIPDFAPVRATILAHPNVAAVIPMGFDTSILGRGNELDELFTDLRLAVKSGNQDNINALVNQSRQQINYIKREVTSRKNIMAAKDEVERDLKLLTDVEADEFWTGLKNDPEPAIMHLETKIAPLSGEKSPVWLRYLGTDLEAFPKLFGKFKIREGRSVLPGERGMLLSHRMREDYLKNLPARLLDKLLRRTNAQKLTIASDPESKRLAGDLSRQYREIIVHLDQDEATTVRAALAEFLGQPANEDLTVLIKAFLLVDDSTIAARHAFFYRVIAPKIRLYEISPGEKIVLRAYTRSGYIKSVAVPVLGVFSFVGIEDSDLAGAFSLIDLVTFRELYGQMTASALQEMEAMRREVNVTQVARESAEDELFGVDAKTPIDTKTAQPNASLPSAGGPLEIRAAPALSSHFNVQESAHGLALNLGVILKDPSALEATRAELSSTFKDKGMGLKIVDWKEASGIVGQFVDVVRLVLLVSVFVITLVALIIINNTLVVSVFDRSREIGTMRAIGMQKTLVIAIFLAETAIIGVLGALPGALLGVIIMNNLEKNGIPAMHDVVQFLFSGPRLFPHLDHNVMILAPLGITVLAVLSSLYAALFAAKVKPSEAMEEKE